MRVPHQKMVSTFKTILLNLDFAPVVAEELAETFAENSLEGVPSHGLNRFPDFIRLCKAGIINKNGIPTLTTSIGAMEVWDGNAGPGICNAKKSMSRAMHLATEYGIGCVALKNTNHWMRGGTYGWQAANEGFISINFTNAMALMVPYGGIESKLGNNPLVISIPDIQGDMVLDMALSQYSMGRVKNHAASNEMLDFDGGYDENGVITNDPKQIEKSRRLSPIGFWKGTGLSLMLDLMCSLLSGGKSTAEISENPPETGVSQIFICFSLAHSSVDHRGIINKIREFTKSSNPEGKIHFPGENIKQLRAENLALGVPVDGEIWENVLNMT